jgi:hypothetical protein
MPKMPAMAMMRWKCATTKKVLCRYSSRMGWAKIGPESPPVMKSDTKPRAKSMGVVRRVPPHPPRHVLRDEWGARTVVEWATRGLDGCGAREPHTVASQLRTLALAGIAMASDATLKAVPAKGFRPATNM